MADEGQHRALVAAELAHEVRNTMQIVQVVAALMRAKSGTDESNELLEELLLRSERAAHLAHRLMELSRAELVGEAADLSAIVAHEVAVARKIAPRGVRVIGEIERGPLRTRLQPNAISEVIVNLVRNAFEAAGNGALVRVVLLRDGEHAVLVVNDNGVGMDEDTQERCFDPFFTTKHGSGTGIGLYSVRAIVERGGGRISLVSERGTGTTFTILLPIVDDQRS
jgi:signal transduction histidine kinase